MSTPPEQSQIKLSKPQLALLTSTKDSPRTVVPYYPPAKKLVEYGFAAWIAKSCGATVLEITEAGKEALEPKRYDGDGDHY